MAKDIDSKNPFIKSDDDYIEMRKAMLPFIAEDIDWEAGTSWWNVPMVGNYNFSYAVGEAMANKLLKFYQSRYAKPPHADLTFIVQSMMAHCEKLGGMAMAKANRNGEQSPEYDCFHGQYVGFFNTISKAISDLLARK